MKKEIKEAKISKTILQNVFKYEVYSKKRIGGTWMFGYKDRNRDKQCLYWQFYFGKFKEKGGSVNAM